MQLQLLKTEHIRDQSFGEVTTPIQFSNNKPREGGLFCQRIFGPVDSYTCGCASLVGSEFSGKTCDVCHVDCVSSDARKERFGHIELPYPVINPMFFDIVAEMLGISRKLLTQIALGDTRFILAEGNTPCTLFRGFSIEISDSSESQSCVTSLYKVANLLSPFTTDSSATKKQKAAFRKLEDNNLSITDLFFHAIPVLPPQLRPALEGKDGKLIIHSINSIYTKLIEQVQRATRIIENDKIIMPQVLEELASRSFQRTVNALFLDGLRTPSGEKVPSIYSLLKGKTGFIRGNLMGKRVDYSGRCVITSGPAQPLDTVIIPECVAYELLKPFIIRELLESQEASTYREAKNSYILKKSCAIEALYRTSLQHYILLNRQPSLHRNSIMAFKMKIHTQNVLLFPPMITSPFNADFDGDTMALYLPISNTAHYESEQLLSIVKNQRTIRTGEPSFTPSHEMIIGIDYMCRAGEDKTGIIENNVARLEIMLFHKQIKINTLISFRDSGTTAETTLGRLLLKEAIGVEFPGSVNKKDIIKIINTMYNVHGEAGGLVRLKKLQDLAFKYVTESGFSVALCDINEPTAKQGIVESAEKEQQEIDQNRDNGDIQDTERYELVIRLWQRALSRIFDAYITETPETNSVHAMYRTGARVSKSQVSQLVAAKGMFARANNTIMEIPIKNSMRSGLTVADYFKSCSGSRKSMADKVFITPRTGYFARKLVAASRDLYILGTDCGTTEGLSIERCAARGRTILRDDPERAGHVIVRSPVTCQGHTGICAACYGDSVHRKETVSFGEPVGIIAASCLSEPATQLSMRTFHTSGSVSLAESQLTVRAAHAGVVKIRKHGGATSIWVGSDMYLVHNVGAKVLVQSGSRIEEDEVIAVYVDTSLQNEDIAATLPTLEGYCDLRSAKDPICIRATQTGVVSITSEESGIRIRVDDADLGLVRCAPILVYDMQAVTMGEKLTYGNTSILKFYTSTRNLPATASLFIECVQRIYKMNGIHIEQVHVEMIFRAMSELVETDEGVLGLRRYHDKGDIVLKGITSVSRDYPSWMKGISFGWIKKHLINAVLSSSPVYDIPSERLMRGERTEWS